MAYKYGNRNQITFLPDSIEQYVGEDDPVRFYDVFVDTLDLRELDMELDENAVGNSSYDPVTMLKILVYGYSYGWRSSRKLERALHHNLSFVWLAGGLKPDHKTISNFRKDNKKSLAKVLKQCARLCLKLDLIEGNTLFVDGSKFRANAGRSQSKSIAAWEKQLKEVDKRIEELLEECRKLDESETESMVKVKRELRGKETLKSKIGQLLEEMEESSSNSTTATTSKSTQKNRNPKINGTDPDCKVMKGHQGSHTSYNSQMVTEDKNGLIVSIDVTAAMNDLNQLNKQVGIAEKTLGKSAKTVCADAGYSSVDDLKSLLDQGKNVIVPNNKQAQSIPKETRFDKSAFSYNATTDTYTCPIGEQLYRGSYRSDSNRIEYRMKKPASCRACIHFGTCTSSKAGRRIYRLANEESKELLAKSYNSDSGQEIYKRRKMKVEHPFGHIKRNLGATAFLLRGLEGVNAEMSLLGTCFNIARMITIMGGVKPLITKLKNA